MTYCLDTNTLIHAWNFWYKQHTHPSLWAAFETLGRSGTLKIPEQVYDEIQQKDDHLAAWCQKTKTPLVYEATDATEAEYARLVKHYPMMAGGLGLGNDYADLYVVAVASVNDATVVTNEDRGFFQSPNMRTGRSRKNYTIMNVCFEEDVDVIRGYSILDQEGWVFHHDS